MSLQYPRLRQFYLNAYGREEVNDMSPQEIASRISSYKPAKVPTPVALALQTAAQKIKT